MVAFFATPAGRWLVMLVLVMAACGASFFFGMDYEQGEEAKVRLQEADDARTRMLARMELDRKTNDDLAATLKTERAGRTQEQQDFEEKLADAPRGTIFETRCPQQQKPSGSAAGSAPVEGSAVAAQGISEPVGSAAPGPESLQSAGLRLGARFSATGCGLWNDAVLAGFTAVERARLPPGIDACAGPVEPEDAMRNLHTNLALLGECRLREQQLHKFLHDRGFMRGGG